MLRSWSRAQIGICVMIQMYRASVRKFCSISDRLFLISVVGSVVRTSIWQLGHFGDALRLSLCSSNVIVLFSSFSVDFWYCSRMPNSWSSILQVRDRISFSNWQSIFVVAVSHTTANNNASWNAIANAAVTLLLFFSTQRQIVDCLFVVCFCCCWQFKYFFLFE